MGERVKIEDIPGTHFTGYPAWPWEVWAKIPVGEAEEITHLINGRNLDRFVGAIRVGIRYHNGALRLIRRGERVWITKRD